MKHHNCLNCDTQLLGKFCSNCGQKADTHRITFKHFIMHDVLHGVWHFEKGMLFTAKEALFRPGKAALDYIAGKRIAYYNVFYFILLLIGLAVFIENYHEQLFESYNGKIVSSNDVTDKKLASFMTKYAKLLIFSFVPLFAINTYLLFRKKKLNLSEHFIIAGIIYLGIMIIAVIGNLFYFFDFTKHFEILSDIANILVPIIILLYVIFSYYTAFKDSYSKIGFSFRMMFFLFFLTIELLSILVFIFSSVTDWKFGSIKYHT